MKLEMCCICKHFMLIFILNDTGNGGDGQCSAFAHDAVMVPGGALW